MLGLTLKGVRTVTYNLCGALQEKVHSCSLFSVRFHMKYQRLEREVTRQLHVAKFGGTSLADYQSIQNCIRIIQKDPNIRIVVVSAPAGITELLNQLRHTNADLHRLMHKITQIICAILNNFKNLAPIYQIINALLSELKMAALNAGKITKEQRNDKILSFGEHLSAQIFKTLLNEKDIRAKYICAQSIIQTDSNHGQALPILKVVKENTATMLLPHLNDFIVVTEGYIGADENGYTTTLGRGGSDYSAALLAESCSANALQIWTDVAGFYSTDPRIIPSAQVINEFSFNEAAELATFGAKVLHPASLLPVIRQNIPVFIGHSKMPQQGGTWIRHESQITLPVIRGIALRKNQSLMTVSCRDMFHAKGFLANVFGILAKHNISIDLVTTSEVNVALTLDHSFCATGNSSDNIQAAISQLQETPNVHISIESKLSLIALVGNHINSTPGIASRLFHSIQNYNIRMFGHGASDHNICFLIAEDDDEAILQQLHQKLITQTEVAA